MKNPLSTIIRELSSLYHLESRVAPLLGFILLAISNRGSSGCLNSPISGFSARSRHGMPSHEKKKHEQTTPSESLTKIQSQSGIEAAKSEYTLVEQAKRHDAHPNQITQWKIQLLEITSDQITQWKVQLLEIISEFFSWSSATTSPSVDVKSLHAKIGSLILENYFLKGALTKAGSLSTKLMIDRSHTLSLTRQTKALTISRGSMYYQPRPISKSDQALMKFIDRLHLSYPFSASQMLRNLLALRGVKVGRHHMRALMRHISIEALYRKLNTSKKNPAYRIYLYLLRHLNAEQPNQVWAMDIIYIPMVRGFVYHAVVVDWHTHHVLSLKTNNIRTSMDGKICWRDNVLSNGCGEASNTKRCISMQ